ncbi:MAG: hypothetical protein JWL59_2045 [Chthoniobacteraceae bacterium]|nr:hypothetical protein [Chthoniobacteraceae bacterium]
MKFHQPFLVILAGLTLCSPTKLHAVGATVHFDALSDISSFSYPNSTAQTTFGFDNTTGVGGTGGSGVFQSTAGAGSEKRVLALYDGLNLNSPDVTSWETSVYLKFSDLVSTPANGTNSAEARFGFFAANPAYNYGGSKPQDFVSLNPSFYAKAKFEWERGAGKEAVISIEPLFSTGSTELGLSGASKMKTTQFDLNDWFKFTLTITRDDTPGNNRYNGSAAIYDVGLDGRDDPLLLTGIGGVESASSFQSWTGAVNGPFSTSAHISGAMVLGGEKGLAWSNLYNLHVDEYSVMAVTVPEPNSLILLALMTTCFRYRRSDR